MVLHFAHVPNYLSPLLCISYPLQLETRDEGILRYGKGPLDLCFLAFYVLVFSFIRQGALQHVITPLAVRAGIPKGRKLERFNEQGYAFLYWSASSIIGLVRDHMQIDGLRCRIT